ncbi:hypothetical protein As57867_005144, partial [Aphanomyces stellatus]
MATDGGTPPLRRWLTHTQARLIVGNRSLSRLLLFHVLHAAFSLWLFVLVVVMSIAVVPLCVVLVITGILQCAPQNIFDRLQVSQEWVFDNLRYVALVHARLNMQIRNLYDVRRAVDTTTPSMDVMCQHQVAVLLYFMLWYPMVTLSYLLYINYAHEIAGTINDSGWIVLYVLGNVGVLYLMAWIAGGVTQGIVVPLFPTVLASPSAYDGNNADRYMQMPPEKRDGSDDGDNDVELYVLGVPRAPFVATGVFQWMDSVRPHDVTKLTSITTGRHDTTSTDPEKEPRHNRPMTSDVAVDSLLLWVDTLATKDSDHVVVTVTMAQHANDDNEVENDDESQISPTNYSALPSAPAYGLLSPSRRKSDATSAFAPVFRSVAIDGSDKQDAVHLLAYAPPTVAVEMDFTFAIWAFLVNQREDMHDQAKAESTAVRQLSREVLLPMRRGAMAHVRLEVPDGFEVLDDPVKAFSWTGDITSV